MDEELKQAKHDAWVAQTMIATVLATVGAVVVTKETAARDYSDFGIEMTETDEGGIMLFLKEKDNEDD